MPHLTLEHTQNLRGAVGFDDLFERMHTILADVGIKKGEL